MIAFAQTSFGYEVVDAASSFFVAGIPVLYCRIFYLGTFVNPDFHNGGMQLVFVPHGGCAAFEITYITVVVGDNEGTLELPGVCRIDAEVG